MTDLSWLLVRLVVALVMFLFGIDQIVQPQSWMRFLPAWVTRLSPLSPEAQMRSHAAGNIILGLALASGLWPALVLWVVLLWWLSILPFAFFADWRLGLRDLVAVVAIIAMLLTMYS